MAFRTNIVHMSDGGGSNVIPSSTQNTEEVDFRSVFCEIFEERDKNGDWVLSADEVEGLEDEYLELFAAIGGLDKEEGLSLADIKTADQVNQGYSEDSRLENDETGWWVSVESWSTESGNNGSLYGIINHSYDLGRLASLSGKSEDEIRELLLGQIASDNGISDVNVIETGAKISLPDPYVLLGIQEPEQVYDFTIGGVSETGTTDDGAADSGNEGDGNPEQEVEDETPAETTGGKQGLPPLPGDTGTVTTGTTPADTTLRGTNPNLTTDPQAVMFDPDTEPNTNPAATPETPPAEVDYTQVENLEGLLETLPEGSEAYNQVNAIISAYDAIEYANENGIWIDTSEQKYNVPSLLTNVLDKNALNVEQKATLIGVMAEKDPDMMLSYLSPHGNYIIDPVALWSGLLDDCETPEQAIYLGETYKNIYGESSIPTLSSFVYWYSSNNENNEENIAYVDSLIELYDGATPEEVRQLNELYQTPFIVQQLLKNDVETEKINKLITNMGGFPTAQEMLENIPSEDREHIDLWENNYPTVKSILTAVNNDKLDSKMALYLLSKLGNIDEILEEFRDMKKGHQESYLPTLLNLFSM